MIHLLSLGAGVQSSMMALGFAKGFFDLEQFPMPERAIFSDTGAEPQYVYDWLEWLTPLLPFPVDIVSAGDLRQMTIDSCGPNKDKGRFAASPFYVSTGGAREGMLRRQCTREFKVTPITQRVRKIAGLTKGQRAPKDLKIVQYIGISYDEAIRQKPAREKYLIHRWPLVELEIRRLDCLTWMKENGFPMPKKSACTFCPYRSDADWLEMKTNHPDAWADAVAVDNHIRAGASGMRERSSLYVHRSLTPLQDVVFDSRQEELFGGDFGDECEGMCGV